MKSTDDCPSMTRKRLQWRRWIAACLLSSAFLGGVGAVSFAQSVAIDSAMAPAGGDSLRRYHQLALPAQPLAAALAQFSAQTGIKLLTVDTDLAGKTAAPVNGSYSALEGLTLLLMGSGLTFERGEDEFLRIKLLVTQVLRASPVLQQAWSRYHRSIDEMREKTEQAMVFQDPRHRAKGYHALIEAQAMAYNFAIAPRLDHPRIQEATGWQTDFYTLGLNGPDGQYGVTFLDGRQSYRVRGRIGDVKIFMFQVFNGLMGSAQTKVIGNHVAADFVRDADGRFEAIFSAEKHSGNWMQLDPDSSYNWVMIRRLMGDWNDDPGELTIEMISKPDPHFYDYDEFDEAGIAARIDRANGFYRYLVESWNIGLYQMYLSLAAGRKNVLVPIPGTTASQVGSPVSNYVNGIYEVADDEALIVELKEIPVTAAYWGFQLSDAWFRSLDFVNRLSSINMDQAAIDSDGIVRAVISRDDPGVANWLDNTGHREGMLVFRNYAGTTMPIPTIRRVKFAELRKQLPADTRMVTPEQRRASIEARQAGMLKLLGE